MKRLLGFLLGVCEFIVGDDWVIAGGVVLALGTTALISDSSSAWLLMPIAVACLLTFSVWREARKRVSL